MTKLHCPTCGVHIDEHEAGGCLDLWAGEVVMGFGYNEESSGLSKRWFGRPDRYSERIGPAWMLVEKLVNDSLSPTVFWDDGDDKPEHAAWAACIAHYGETEDEFWLCDGFADTAPLAITRAAIKASLKGKEK